MVTTRHGDYITPEKNPPAPLKCSPALRRPGDEDEEAEAKEGKAISSAAVDYAASLTFNNKQLYYENDVAEGGNDDTGGDHDRGLNDDDGGNDRDEEGEQQVEEEMGEAWERVTKKRKSQMSNDELRTYFDSHLRGVGECPNPSCNCIAIIADSRDVRDSVVRYLCWFNAKTKYEQDSIVVEWLKYSSYLKKGSKYTLFRLPFIDDSMTVVPEAVRMHVLCSRGLLLVLNWGSRRWRSIRKAPTVTGVMPMHKAKGKVNYNSLCNNDRKMGPLMMMRHLEYLMELGDRVRATRVITTLVKGMEARVNCNNDDDKRYLPMSMDYSNSYKRYLASSGYTNVRSTASGAFILGEREDGEAVDSGDFVSFPTYYYKWKTSFPKLKVSKPIEDICAYCYAFANRHKYLANRAINT